MTREEAIAYGRRVIDLGLNDETQAFCELAIKALEQQPKEHTEERTETHACDCVSKKGHWLSQSEYCKMNNLIPSGLGCYFWCSECNCGIDYKYFHLVDYNYCPKCGIKMQEVKK